MASMRAREYAPIERLETAPIGPYVPPGQREEALSDALRGVDLGANDELIVGWLVRHLDNTTLRTLVSLIERARGAGMVHVLDIEASLASQARQQLAAREAGSAGPVESVESARPDGEDRPEAETREERAALNWPSSWVAGNSGPGF
jgi:hypothetical protein